MKNRHALAFALLAAFLLVVTMAAFATSDGNPAEHALASDLKVSTRLPLGPQAGDAPSIAGQSTSDAAAVNRLGLSAEPSLEELTQFARGILDYLRSDVRDYTATLVRRERIAGTLGGEVRMEAKIRNPTEEQGLAAYLKFLEPRSTRGREVIWIDGFNQNKLIAHEGGFKNLLRLELAPDSVWAMLGNKYPITEIGLIRLCEKLIEKTEREVDLSQCRVQVVENQRVGDRPCVLIQVTQPKTVPGADFNVAQVFVDIERMVPLRYAAFLWPTTPGEPPPLEEEYTYLDLRLNVGLDAMDFDPENPDYDFP